MTEDDLTARKIQIGSEVRAEGMPRVYTVVEGPNRRDQFRIAFGQLTLWVDRAKLHPAATKPKDSKTKLRKQKSAHQTASTQQRSIDLHGIRVKEALDTLERLIDRALVDGVTQIEVIHGLGTGKLKAAIHFYLKGCRSISAFKLDDLNPGTTWIYL